MIVPLTPTKHLRLLLAAAFFLLALAAARALPPGDVSGDGTLTLFDSTLISDHLNGIKPITGDALIRADANGDAVIDVADVIYINAHPSPAVIIPNVIVTDNDPNWSVDAVTTGTLTVHWLGGGAAPLVIEQYIAGSVPSGFLRKIIAIQNMGGGIYLLTTEDASLSEVVESGQFSGGLDLAAGKGVSRTATKNSLGLDWNLNDLLLFNQGGQQCKIDDMTYDLNLEDPDFDVSYEDHTLQYYRLVYRATGSFSAKVNFTSPPGLSLDVNLVEVDLLDLAGIPVVPIEVYFLVGIIPVQFCIKPTVSAKLKLQLESVDVATGRVSGSISIHGGVEYRNGSWQVIGGSDASFSVSETAFTPAASGSLKLSVPFGLKVSPYNLFCVGISETVSASVGIGPYLKFEASGNVQTSQCSVALSWGIETKAKIQAKLLDYFKVTYDIAEYPNLGPKILWSDACPGVPALPPPPAPVNVLASDSTFTDKIRVTWSDVQGETGYRLYRAASAAGPFGLVTPLGSGTIAYDDPRACGGTPYFYRLLAYNAQGNSPYSSTDGGSTALCGVIPTPNPTPTPVPGQEITFNLPGGAVLTLVKVPQGSFQMGSVDSGWSSSFETPVHNVTINYDLYIGKFEVTQKQWLAVRGSWPGTAPNSSYGVGDNFPAYNISWDDIQNFEASINALGLGGTFRLPSEAEWEYAARGGTQTRFHFGNSTCTFNSCTDCDLSQYSWWCGNNTGSPGQPTYGSKVVGGKLPNPFGLYDMAGSVWEWAEDYWHTTYAGAPLNGSAWLSPTSGSRMLRGGSWLDTPDVFRPAHRNYDTPGYRSNRYGFRLAWTPSPQEVVFDLPGGVPLTMVKIPQGSFLMGSTQAEVDAGWANTGDLPQHQVSINYDYYIGKFEITQEQWLAVRGTWPGTAPSSDYGVGDDFPAYYISWNDIQNFESSINALGLGGTFRLPTEAEWEYAARGGTQTRFHFGNSTCSSGSCADCDLSQYAWWCGNNTGSPGQPTYGSKIVGGKLPNPFGLSDTVGNVWEWVEDYWHSGYTGAPTNGSAWVSPSSSYRVHRGGFWGNNPDGLPTAHAGNLPAERYYFNGFRLAWTP